MTPHLDRFARGLVMGTMLCAVRPIAAAQEWQLVDAGVPLAAEATYLIHVSSTATTYLRIEDQYMVPQWWTLQGTSWVRQLEESYPEPMYKASIAYDPVRNVIVRFGGSDKNLNIIAETWEHDGSSWVQRTDVGAPPGRIRAPMAYDSYRNVMVLFGGYGADDVERNDTWEYDGVQWQLRTFSTNPPARFDASMAFDANRRKIVLSFGRTLSAGAMNDTWEYNGTKWTNPHTSGLPIPRYEAAAAYDPIRQAVYTFGGEPSGQTLRWGTQGWEVVYAPGGPLGRFAPSLVFDASRGKLVMFGGERGVDDMGDTWEFDGVAWSELPRAISEGSRVKTGAAFDIASGQPLLYGGYRCCGNVYLDRTAKWVGTSWSNVPTPTDPGRLIGPAMDGTPADGVILFGGFDVDRISNIPSVISREDQRSSPIAR